MLNGRRSVINGRPLVSETSLKEVLLDVAAEILQMTRMVVLVRHLRTWSTTIVLPLAMETYCILARSACSGDHSLRLLPGFGCVVDEVLHVSRHVEKFTGEAGRVLLISLRNDLVHSDIEVLGLLERRMILLLEVLRLTWRRSCAWNHWAHHSLSNAVCLGELLLGLGERLVEHVARWVEVTSYRLVLSMATYITTWSSRMVSTL